MKKKPFLFVINLAIWFCWFLVSIVILILYWIILLYRWHFYNLLKYQVEGRSLLWICDKGREMWIMNLLLFHHEKLMSKNSSGSGLMLLILLSPMSAITDITLNVHNFCIHYDTFMKLFLDLELIFGTHLFGEIIKCVKEWFYFYT
jgi:hypothetical protein